MRGWLVGVFLWLAVGGTAAAASSADASAPAIVIQADEGRPTHLATYRGPDGASVPIGSCGAVVDTRVWVLPCTDTRVAAYRRALTADAERAGRVAHQLEALGVLVTATIGAMTAEFLASRRKAARKGA